MKSLCVFCGSSAGSKFHYAAAARELGALMAKRGIALVYGGSSIGMMGAVADGVLGAGGIAIGVIPRALATKEVAHEGLTEQLVVTTMHERKALMAERSDAFAALPGGIGTLEELFETWTWGQLGIHTKPVGILNVAGYYDGLLAFLDNAMAQRFVQVEHRAALVVETDPALLLDRLAAAPPRPPVTKWMTLDER